MSGYCYVSNNLKDIKDHIWAYMISYKIFFHSMVTVFKQRKPKLSLSLIFYSSIRFASGTAFVSEQIVENRFRALLEISGKFVTKFNVFGYMILPF